MERATRSASSIRGARVRERSDRTAFPRPSGSPSRTCRTRGQRAISSATFIAVVCSGRGVRRNQPGYRACDDTRGGVALVVRRSAAPVAAPRGDGAGRRAHRGPLCRCAGRDRRRGRALSGPDAVSRRVALAPARLEAARARGPGLLPGPLGPRAKTAREVPDDRVSGGRRARGRRGAPGIHRRRSVPRPEPSRDRCRPAVGRGARARPLSGARVTGAAVNAWLWGATALLLGLTPCGWLAVRASRVARGRLGPRSAAADAAARTVRLDPRRAVRRLPGTGRCAVRARRLERRHPVHPAHRACEDARPATQVTRRARLGLFAVSGAALAGLFVWALTGLPAFGDFHGEYGRILNSVAGTERHVTNVASSVVFDYRGFDTLGEEFILFTAVMGVALLLREARDDRERPRDEVRSDAVRAVGLALVGPTVVLGLYIVAHGYLTPGGGFQGGMALAAGLVLLYAAGRYRSYRAASPQGMVDFAEGVSAGGYVAVGIAALIAGSAYLENVVDLGTKGTLAAAGTIPILNATAGLEVAAAMVLLFHEFLEEVIYPE